MTMSQHKNTTNNTQKNMYPHILLESSNSITAETEFCNITKAQGKKLKIVYMNMIKFPKKKWINLLKIYEKTHSGRKWIKQFKT